MNNENTDNSSPNVCPIPRRNEAIEATMALACKKEKKNFPNWLSEDLQKYK